MPTESGTLSLWSISYPSPGKSTYGNGTAVRCANGHTLGLTPIPTDIEFTAAFERCQTNALEAQFPTGPWRKTAAVGPASDKNPAPYIFPNGSALMFYRDWDGTGSHIQLATARRDWRRNESWSFNPPVAGNRSGLRQLWPWQNADAGDCGAEDPYVYRSKRDGSFHAVLHNQWPAFEVQPSNPVTRGPFSPLVGTWQCRGTTLDPTGRAGGHAFSENGVDWGYSNGAYSMIVEHDDGVSSSLPSPCLRV